MVANETDVEVGFQLYGEICEANEHSVSPELWQIYKEIFMKHRNDYPEGFLCEDVGRLYFAEFPRQLNYQRLRREIVPSMINPGLIIEEPWKEDARKRILKLPADATYKQVQMPDGTTLPLPLADQKERKIDDSFQ